MALGRFLLVWLALLCLPGLAGAQTFPKLTGRVVDNANLLDAAQEQALVAKLAALERDTGRQLVVATLPDLQGRDIADYGYRLGREWGIGEKGRNNGALLLVAPTERRVRIEVGYGLEGYLTDAMSALIIANAITPRFKAGDYPGGITAGVDEIAALLKLTPEEAKARSAALAQDVDEDANGMIVIGIMVVIVIFFVAPVVLGAIRGGRRYRSGGGGPIILWGPGTSSSSWGSSSDSSWSSSSDSFSGGGGSFGGGGASGDW